MIEKQKIITKDWFEDLRKEIIKVFLDIENNNSRFRKMRMDYSFEYRSESVYEYFHLLLFHDNGILSY